MIFLTTNPFFGVGWSGGEGVFFYKLTRNPNLTKYLFLRGSGGGDGGVSVRA